MGLTHEFVVICTTSGQYYIAEKRKSPYFAGPFDSEEKATQATSFSSRLVSEHRRANCSTRTIGEVRTYVMSQPGNYCFADFERNCKGFAEDVLDFILKETNKFDTQAGAFAGSVGASLVQGLTLGLLGGTSPRGENPVTVNVGVGSSRSFSHPVIERVRVEKTGWFCPWDYKVTVW
eukprot:CAMPEP_0206467872 /NCGR_PEP_ID=MMETSP0324_2-20121206/29281_1 /ASSEMBLY_ACC=CAM_ASM_000836 /TAXON_ID=2866 /ORGANISM="Crypthecodinium cohnii, Strain Seligo" /LENGTH=176 /DNA_ID=CAMNT_0053941199 /DNA_START=117 /DNA_END=644 /DNA_ORIENTATION=+